MNKHFVVIGLPESGKSTVMTLLAHYRQGSVLGREGLHVRVYPSSDSAQHYLAYNRTLVLEERRFPPATDDLRELHFRVELTGRGTARTLEMRVPDVPGELCSNDLSNASEWGRRLLELIADCDGIVMLVDPASLGREAFGRLRALQSNLERIYLELKDTRPLEGGRLPIPLAVVISKAERYWDDPQRRRFLRRLVWRDGGPRPTTEPGASTDFEVEAEDHEPGASSSDSAALRRILASYAPVGRELVEILERYFARVSFHASSAIGMQLRDGRWRPNLVMQPSGGAGSKLVPRIADPTGLTPVGLLDPILHLAFGPEPREDPLPVVDGTPPVGVDGREGSDLVAYRLKVFSAVTALSLTLGAVVWLVMLLRSHGA